MKLIGQIAVGVTVGLVMHTLVTAFFLVPVARALVGV